MLNWIPAKFFISKSSRDNRKLQRFVTAVSEREHRFKDFNAEDFRNQTEIWKAELDTLALDSKALDRHLQLIAPDAFALVRCSARHLTASDPDWALVPYNVQLAGGNVLFEGRIAEMATGEGKTLTAVAPAYLRTLAGRGVHVVTVNDYLATRDAAWMGRLFDVLGVSVGCLEHGQHPQERKAMYARDVTYGTSSEFGFDYLRDNGMARSADAQVQRGHYFAIVDEVDSVLIDEARTPLIITAPGTELPKFLKNYAPAVSAMVKTQAEQCNAMIRKAHQLHEQGGDSDAVGMLLYKCQLAQPLHPGLRRMKQEPDFLRLLERASLYFHQDGRRGELCDLKDELLFWIDERTHNAELTDNGCRQLAPDCPELFQVGDLVSALAAIDATALSEDEKMQRREQLETDSTNHGRRIHEVRNLVKAYCLYERDRNYLVKDGEIVILDESKGRQMPGRRWSDGLHQAVEAKEGVEIQPESETLASITVQNYFRQYEGLAGMTGTAMTDVGEFKDIYKLDVVEVPTHRPCVRADSDDRVYKTRNEKYRAVVSEIKAAHDRKQPVLVGTANVDASEAFSRLLNRERIPHQVLNARHHDREAEIVERAGEPGSVTISTNMAGRGTDIQLSNGVADLGGLYVIGTERHESRRVDRQLRGRCARQGDPGTSAFFLSLEDDLVRRLDHSGRVASMLEKVGHVEGEPLGHPMLTRTISSAQTRVEKADYERRRQTIKYDDVLNRQRTFIYDWRNDLLQTPDFQSWLIDTLPECIPSVIDLEENYDGTGTRTLSLAPEVQPAAAAVREDLEMLVEEKSYEKMESLLADAITFHVSDACAAIDSKIVPAAEAIRQIALSNLDREWRSHLVEIEALRERIHFQSLAQKDPIVEFTREASFAFDESLNRIRKGIVSAAIDGPAQAAATEARILDERAREQRIADSNLRVILNRESAPLATHTAGRNEPCPCGSGRKFKKCCGAGRD